MARAPITPTRWVLLLILGSLLLRLGFAALLGLGIDESYMVAAGRQLQLSYFDHPPAAWWISWAAIHLFGGNAPAGVRLPFILLFAVSTWLMYRLTSRLYSPRAGLWAAVTLNLSPVFTITTGSWVLPDGPLDCALLAAVLCLTHALQAGRHARAWWLAAGAAAGAAMFSKYLAGLTLLGALIFLVSHPVQRRWLRCPDPWLAGLVAVAAFLPVILWNAEHNWISFFFQGDRALARHWHPFAPLVVLGGEALFVLPWIWLPMMVLLVGALRRGRAEAGEWLLCCLAVPPILLFTVVSLWSPRVLFHWAAPGYLMLFPMLGRQIAVWLDQDRPFVRPALRATAALFLAAGVLVASDVIRPWIPRALGADALRIQAASWRPLAAALDRRGLGNLPLAGVR